MISAPQPSVVHLFTVFRQIGAGELRIPAFQREFVWRDRQILDLLMSVRDQYPIGSILLWHVDKKMLEIARNQVTAFPDVQESYPTNYILDGMQRLSTLYGAFHYVPGQDPSFGVSYDLRNKRFFHDSDRTIFDSDASIPLSSIMSPRKMLEHQSRFAKFDDGDELLEELLATQAAFQDYMIPIVKIQGSDIDRIVGIFERTNSTGTRLDTVDFMRAITWNQNFDLNHALDITRCPLEDDGIYLPEETVIKCVGLLLGVAPSADGLLTLRNRGPAELASGFDKFTPCFARVLDYLRSRLRIESLAFVPYEGQLLVLFKAIGMGEAVSDEDFDLLDRWFWSSGFNESLRGKPDHYVVRAVESWRALVRGQLRGLEPRLRLSEADFFVRRLIKGKALSGAFAAMFAINDARSLLTEEVIPSSYYMAASDLDSFHIILTGSTLKDVGIDVGPSPRVFPNIILTSIGEIEIGQSDWRYHILRLGDKGRFETLKSQFIDEIAYTHLESGNVVEFLRRRSLLLLDRARELVGA